MSYSFRMQARSEDAVLDSLWQLGCTAISEGENEIIAYFNEKLELEFEGEWLELDATDYVAAYYASLQSVALEHVIIAPTHSEVLVKAGQKVLWLDPGMAFGTGHHETTRLILKSLEQLELLGKTVLDVGAGSGILAIAADLLGARTAYGIDIDPLTLSVAQDNARLNRSRASFAVGTLDDITKTFDVVVANLFAELHVKLAAQYKDVLRPTGQLLLSGIMKEKIDTVLEALVPLFKVLDVQHEGEWSFVKAKLK